MIPLILPRTGDCRAAEFCQSRQRDRRMPAKKVVWIDRPQISCGLSRTLSTRRRRRWLHTMAGEYRGAHGSQPILQARDSGRRTPLKLRSRFRAWTEQGTNTRRTIGSRSIDHHYRQKPSLRSVSRSSTLPRHGSGRKVVPKRNSFRCGAITSNPNSVYEHIRIVERGAKWPD